MENGERRKILMSKMKEALNSGWTIADVATVLAHGKNDEGRGFLVTLMEPKKHLSRQVYLPYSPDTERLLTQAPVTLVS
jgi:hypothetical protein